MAFPAPSPADDLAALEELLAGLPGAVVAFSGGVDSSVVAAVAGRALGERALAVTAVSPALATGEIEAAAAVAASIGVAHRVVTSTELEREGYRRNGRDRCYHCKTDLYDRLTTIAGDRVVLSGANADDLGDWRPGLTAAAEHGVRHPLVEAGLGKARIRALAGHSWASPAPRSRRRPVSRRGSRTAHRSPRPSSRRSTGRRPPCTPGATWSCGCVTTATSAACRSRATSWAASTSRGSGPPSRPPCVRRATATSRSTRTRSGRGR